MHLEPKPCSCPDDFSPQPLHKLRARQLIQLPQKFISGCSLVFLSAGFRRGLSTIRWHSGVQGVGWEYEEGEMKARLGDACYRAARGWGGGEGCRWGPVLLCTPAGFALQVARACTEAGDTCAYLRHTHSPRFSSTDYLWITYTAPWKISGARFAVLYTNCIYHMSASFAA